MKKRYIPLLLVFFLILIFSISPVEASYVYFTAGCNSYANWSRQSGNATWNIYTGDKHNGTASFDFYALNTIAGEGNPLSTIVITHAIDFPNMANYTYIFGFWIKIITLDITTPYFDYPFLAVNPYIGGVGAMKSGAGFKFTTVYYSDFWRNGINTTTIYNMNTWYKVECNITAGYGFKVYINGELAITDTTHIPQNVKPTSVSVYDYFPSDYAGVHCFRTDTIFLADSLGLDPSEPYEEEEGPPPEEGPDYTPIINLTIPFLFLFAVPMILATSIGKVGFIVGLCIAAICLYMVGWMPLWAIFLIGLGIILLLLSGRSGLNE